MKHPQPDDTFTLRPATAVDQPTIRQLIRAVGINPLGLHWSRFWVAVTASHRLIGCGQVKSHRDGSWELASIAVEADWRGCGVARALITQLLAGHTGPLWLTCMDRLIPLYAQFGFVEVTATADMPPYFRRISYLFRLITRCSSSEEYLAVMHRPTAR